MKNAKIVNLVKVQKCLENDFKLYNKSIESLIDSAKRYIQNSSIAEVGDNVQFIVQSLYVFGKPIKNVKGVVRKVSNRNVTYSFKKGSFKLLYNKSIKPIAEMMLTEEQIMIMENYIKENKQDYYNTKYYFDHMFMFMGGADDSYNTLEAFKFLIRGIIGSVVLSKTEALSNKNILELKKECIKMNEDFKNICNEENLLIAI